MQIIKLKLSEEHYKDLKEQSDVLGVTIQEFLKIKCLSHYILNPVEAVRRAKDPEFQKKYKGTTFELPDLYPGEGEWPRDDRGIAGGFGRTFFNYIHDFKPEGIEYVEGGHDGIRAKYRLV